MVKRLEQKVSKAVSQAIKQRDRLSKEYNRIEADPNSTPEEKNRAYSKYLNACSTIAATEINEKCSTPEGREKYRAEIEKISSQVSIYNAQVAEEHALNLIELEHKRYKG